MNNPVKKFTKRNFFILCVFAFLYLYHVFIPALAHESALPGSAPARPLDEATPIRIESVTKTGLIHLQSGQTVRLGLLQPAAPNQTPRWRPALVALLKHRQVTLVPVSTDHWGTPVVQMFLWPFRTPSRDWVQGRLVLAGQAIVCPLPGEERMSEALLLQESTARQARRGLWKDNSVRIEPVGDDLSPSADLRLFSGQIKTVARVNGTWYLNFGADWKRDFTVRLSADQARAWRQSGRPPLNSLQGRQVRVRGWLDRYHGPLIDLFSPAQMEFPLLSPPPGESTGNTQ